MRYQYAALLAVLAHGSLPGQTAVEAAALAGRATVTAAPAQGMAKTLDGLTRSMERVLQNMAPGGDAAAAPGVTLVPDDKMRTPQSASRTYEDPKRIPARLAYDELLRRFGPPTLEMTPGPGHRILMYAAKDGITQVELQNGQTLPAEKPRRKPAPPEQASVIVLK